MPQFLNPGELSVTQHNVRCVVLMGRDLGGRTGLFWAGLGILSMIWTYFRQPEMRGRTYGELDVLFERKTSARKFAQTEVDQFEVAQREQENVPEPAKNVANKNERWVEDAGSQ